ncbi:MAG TPA: hypothetical protein VJJ82_04375 [Candidatus Nanoarchaeia archaeon]|nr:hypothetical protein [Candidatus Nanoarchaeia archaeon]
MNIIKILLATLLSAGTALAQSTGGWGMMGSGMMGWSPFTGIWITLFWIGLVIVIWLWIVKLWKEVRRMK